MVFDNAWLWDFVGFGYFSQHNDFFGHFWAKNYDFQFPNLQNGLNSSFSKQKHWKWMFLWSLEASWSEKIVQDFQKLAFWGFWNFSSYGPILPLRVHSLSIRAAESFNFTLFPFLHCAALQRNGKPDLLIIELKKNWYMIYHPRLVNSNPSAQNSDISSVHYSIL